MNKPKKILLAILIVAVAIGSFFGVRSYLQRGVVEVQTGRVVRQDLLQVVTASGEIKPRNYINIGANSMGRITDIYVEEGDVVEKGQRLAKLETVQPAAEVKSQKASLNLFKAELSAQQAAIEANEARRRTQKATLKRAKAELQRARVNFERASQLLEDRLIARQEYDQRRADFEAATAVVEEAQARLQELAVQKEQLLAQEESARQRIEQADAQLTRASDILEKHYSVSPLDGIVTNLPVRVGETVVPGIQNSPASLIMTIADMSLITAEVKVDETDIVNVELGQETEVSIDAFPDRPFEGHIIEIGNTAILRSTGLAASQVNIASQEAKDFKVIVALDKPSMEIRPGMSCTARITTATRRAALTLPIQALTVRLAKDLNEPEDPDSALANSTIEDPREEIEGVFIIKDGEVEFRPVDTGITGTTHIEIVDGLQEGDEIVTGSYKILRTIRPGARVRVNNNPGESSGWW